MIQYYYNSIPNLYSAYDNEHHYTTEHLQVKWHYSADYSADYSNKFHYNQSATRCKAPSRWNEIPSERKPNRTKTCVPLDRKRLSFWRADPIRCIHGDALIVCGIICKENTTATLNLNLREHTSAQTAVVGRFVYPYCSMGWHVSYTLWVWAGGRS